ncbi:DNA-directed RNA polymerase subunit beta [Paenibacillus koleovorans]|uniref:DNA-directed RNA polymerase subunit beta n=1 Tax=Paenibacillus koleovorans TaxID=121608 RepID=UPI000FD6DA03|nr:DNA-directed RNA polymerase subunit beta [Paenibacillus koleovorans]
MDQKKDELRPKAPPGSVKPGLKPTTSSPSPAKGDKPAKTRKPIPPWARISFYILRLLLVPVLCVAALIVGVVVGYSYIGGRESSDVWQLETWKHLFNLVFGN